MKIPHTVRDLALLFGSLAFALGGIAMVGQGKPGGWAVLGFFGFCALISVAAPFFPERMSQNVDISDWGVRRTVGNEISEAVSWQELSQVSVATTSDGPAEDVFFLLQDSAGKDVVVSHSVAVEKGLLEVLQKRLPGFDNMALVKAMGSTADRIFVVWRAPEAEQAGAADRPKAGSG